MKQEICHLRLNKLGHTKGNRIWRHNPVATSLNEKFDEIYSYDGVHRLKEMQRGTLNGGQTALTSKTFAQCWTLDSTGNWTGFREDDNGDNTWGLIQERTANGVNEITGLTNTTGPVWSSPAYNRAGNMTTIPTPQTAGLDWNTLSTDEWSDLTTDEWAGLDASLTRSATYDAWNRLVKITDNDVVLSDYAYDAAKRRIIQRSYNSGALTETRHYYYTQPAQWQVLEERLGTSPDSADTERQFVWGLRYIDDLIVRDRDTNADGTLDERLYACQDGNWNVTAIVDDSGAAQERYAYSAYGVPVFLTAGFGVVSGSTSGWETLYGGYRWETATEALHVRHRVYLGQIGVWVQRDLLEYHDGMNFIQYAQSTPLQVLDSMGLQITPMPSLPNKSSPSSTTQPLLFGGIANFEGCSSNSAAPGRPSAPLAISIINACSCLATALNMLENYDQNTENYYRAIPLGDRSLLANRSTRERLKGMINNALDACQGRKTLKFVCKSCLETETRAYVPFNVLSDSPPGDTIYLCNESTHWQQPNPEIIIHEFGRLFNGLGGSAINERDWDNVYRWNDLVGTLCSPGVVPDIKQGRCPFSP